jgi:hypothetical protein
MMAPSQYGYLKKRVLQRIDQANDLGREEASLYSEVSSAAPASQLTFAVAARISHESRRLVARSDDENRPNGVSRLSAADVQGSGRVVA